MTSDDGDHPVTVLEERLLVRGGENTWSAPDTPISSFGSPATVSARCRLYPCSACGPAAPSLIRV